MRVYVCPEAPSLAAAGPVLVMTSATHCIWCGELLGAHQVLDSAPGVFTLPSIERQARAEQNEGSLVPRTNQVQDDTVGESR